MAKLNSNAALSASALVITGLIIFQATRMAPEARADLVASNGNVTALTVSANTDDVLMVINGRQEELLVYRVENQTSVELFARHSLPRLFADARAGAMGRGR